MLAMPQNEKRSTRPTAHHQLHQLKGQDKANADLGSTAPALRMIIDKTQKGVLKWICEYVGDT